MLAQLEYVDDPNDRTFYPTYSGASYYMATADFATTAVSTPMAIGVPRGVHWQGGSLLNIELIFQTNDADERTSWNDGWSVRDPFCATVALVILGPGVCGTGFAVPPTALDANLRKLLPDEAFSRIAAADLAEVVRTADNAYLASGPFVLPPPDYSGTMVVLAEKGAFVKGGVLGTTRVYSLVSTSRAEDAAYQRDQAQKGRVMWDKLCWGLRQQEVSPALLERFPASMRALYDRCV
jgi:hypothetical protein